MELYGALEKQVKQLKINEEKTWTDMEEFYKDGKLITLEQKIHVKRTAGTWTSEISVSIKDKDGKLIKGKTKKFEGSEGWGGTISNWIKSWVE